MSTANQNGVRYSVCVSYLTMTEVQIVNKTFVDIAGFTVFNIFETITMY